MLNGLTALCCLLVSGNWWVWYYYDLHFIDQKKGSEILSNFPQATCSPSFSSSPPHTVITTISVKRGLGYLWRRLDKWPLPWVWATLNILVTNVSYVSSVEPARTFSTQIHNPWLSSITLDQTLVRLLWTLFLMRPWLLDICVFLCRGPVLARMRSNPSSQTPPSSTSDHPWSLIKLLTW